MKPEILEMHKRLQPLYKKMMGDLRPYAPVFCSNNNPIETLIDCHYCCPELIDEDCKHRIIIPLPIDRDNPERGLWGMVDWNRYSCWLYGGKISIHSKDREEIEPRYLDPEEALLMALLEQEKL